MDIAAEFWGNPEDTNAKAVGGYFIWIVFIFISWNKIPCWGQNISLLENSLSAAMD